jgi:hypothetical protein
VPAYSIHQALFLQYNTVQSNSCCLIYLTPPPYIESAHRSANLSVPEILGYNTYAVGAMYVVYVYIVGGRGVLLNPDIFRIDRSVQICVW